IELGAPVGAVWALLRIPIGHRTSSDWARLFLDGATVILGATVFVWYLALAPALAGAHNLAGLWAPAAIGVVCLAGLSAVIKVVLAGAGPVDVGALSLLGIGLLIGAVSASFATIIKLSPEMVPGHLFIPVICLVAILAGERQRRAVGRPAAPTPARGR